MCLCRRLPVHASKFAKKEDKRQFDERKKKLLHKMPVVVCRHHRHRCDIEQSMGRYYINVTRHKQIFSTNENWRRLPQKQSNKSARKKLLSASNGVTLVRNCFWFGLLCASARGENAHIRWREATEQKEEENFNETTKEQNVHFLVFPRRSNWQSVII